MVRYNWNRIGYFAPQEQILMDSRKRQPVIRHCVNCSQFSENIVREHYKTDLVYYLNGSPYEIYRMTNIAVIDGWGFFIYLPTTYLGSRKRYLFSLHCHLLFRLYFIRPPSSLYRFIVERVYTGLIDRS